MKDCRSQKNIFSDFSSEIAVSESSIKEKPTKLDIKNVKVILDDFCIDVIIPEFKTREELRRWLKETIKKKLGGDD